MSIANHVVIFNICECDVFSFGLLREVMVKAGGRNLKKNKKIMHCRAELGRNRLIIKIQKRDVQFYNHLKGRDSQTFHNKAIVYREMNLEKSPLSKLVLGLCSQTQTNPTEPQDSSTIRPNQITTKQKDNYLTHWKELTKKTKQTRLLFVTKQRVHSGRIPDHCD